MDTDPIIARIVERIVTIAHPERVILFGSRARGHALRASDYDFLVLKAGAYHPREVAAAIYRGLRGIHASVEVIVAAPEEAAERADIPWMVYAPALREGSVV